MDTDAHGLETNLTEAVIGSAFEVSKALGAGFLEKVYERAILRELALRGVSAKKSGFVSSLLHGAVCGRILCRFAG